MAIQLRSFFGSYVSRVLASALPPAVAIGTTLVAIPLAHQSLPPGGVEQVIIALVICSFAGTASPGASIALFQKSANNHVHQGDFRTAYALNFILTFFFLAFYFYQDSVSHLLFILVPLITLAHTMRALIEGRREFWRSAALKLMAISLPPLFMLLWLLQAGGMPLKNEPHVSVMAGVVLVVVLLGSCVELFKRTSRPFLKVAAAFAPHGIYVMCLYQMDKAFAVWVFSGDSLSEYLYQVDLVFKIVGIQSVIMAPFLPAMLSTQALIARRATIRAAILSVLFAMALISTFLLSKAFGFSDFIHYLPLKSATESTLFLAGSVLLSGGALLQRSLLSHQSGIQRAYVFMFASIAITIASLCGLFLFGDAGAVVLLKGITEFAVLVAALLYFRRHGVRG